MIMIMTIIIKIIMMTRDAHNGLSDHYDKYEMMIL